MSRKVCGIGINDTIHLTGHCPYKNNSYISQIIINGKLKYLGSYDTSDLAELVYISKNRIYN